MNNVLEIDLKFRKNCGGRFVKDNTDIGLSSLLVLDVANSEVEDVGREPFAPCRRYGAISRYIFFQTLGSDTLVMLAASTKNYLLADY